MNTKIFKPAATAGFSGAETGSSSWTRLRRIGGQAALMVGALLVIAPLDMLITALRPGAGSTWLSPLQNNWLVILFKLHAGFQDVQQEALYRLNVLDLVLMVLIAIVFLGLYAALRGASKAWLIVALAQPFLGIVLFLITKNAGRSGVMGAVLVISLVMLRSGGFGRFTAIAGIAASVLLLAADFSVGAVQWWGLAILAGASYLLLAAWFFLVGQRLLSPQLHPRADSE